MDFARDHLRRLADRLRGRMGSRVVATLAALLLLALTGTLVLASLPGGRRTTAPLAKASTATTAATDTPSPTGTLKPTPRPTQVVHAPKPPPFPTKPPSTPTPRPTNTAGAGVTPIPSPTATPCGPGAYQGGNPTQDQIRAALQAAATKYGLPVNMLYAVAWQESRWHQDVVACDGGIGLMQIQNYTAPWLNGQSVPVCGLAATSYDVYQYQDNAMLGAKFLKWLYCFYSYWGNNGGTSVSNPGAYTAAWYYKNVPLRYPDTNNADGTPNPNSLCVAVFTDTAQPWYQRLPSTTADPWSCPFGASLTDNSDHATVLDITVSAYNEGPGNVSQYGINNWWYVHGVEGYIPQFAAGTLPQ